jgi:hypothetical protein
MQALARLKALLRAAGLGLATAVPAHAETLAVGTVWLCRSSEGRASVVAWVGRVERWADHGVKGAPGEVVLVHAQMQAQGSGDMGRAGHLPFEASAFDGCSPLAAGSFAPDEDAFEEGYGLWLEAVRDQGAGAFTVPAADAHWLAMGIRDGAMNS